MRYHQQPAFFSYEYVVKFLQEKGGTVRVLELPDVPLSSNVEVVRGSICDADIALKALKGFSEFIIWRPILIYGLRIRVIFTG
ncbi:hypothetical protein ABF87_05780 [Nitrosomonas sp. JL21]|nr:hypothetical protein [Nitrosomonas sp. JL21]